LTAGLFVLVFATAGLGCDDGDGVARTDGGGASSGMAGAAGGFGGGPVPGSAGAGGGFGGGPVPGVAGAGGGLGGGPPPGTAGAGGDPAGTGNPSCAGLTGTECGGDDCCASLLVPGGAITFPDGRPGSVINRHVTVPSFRLDKYEVTVARFRAFMNAAEAWQAAGDPAEGAGAHPDVPGSGFRRLWLTWTMSDGSAGLTPGIAIQPNSASSAPPVYAVPGSDAFAVNWVPWHIAFAFCIWDGGRLPADAEWVYAAHGGEEQTTFAWGNAPTSVEMFAVIPGAVIPYPYSGTNPNWRYLAIPVGSHPASVGRFGHHDLMAGLWEYTRDTPTNATTADAFIWMAGEETPPTTFSGFEHRSRGGEWQAPGQPRSQFLPVATHSQGLVGFRCARDVR
jgi:formylglycine-generating enzyme required for sulfatase activity